MSDQKETAQESAQDDRYGTFETGDGSVIVYDRKEPTAWIQSDFAVDVGAE